VTVVLAHGLGDPAALPLPLPIVLALVAGAVLGLSSALSRRARARVSSGGAAAPRPDHRVAAAAPGRTGSRRAAPREVPLSAAADAGEVAGGGPGGWVLPGVVGRVAGAGVVRGVLRAAGVLGAVGTVALAAVGPAAPGANPAPRLVLVVAWAGLVPLSLVAPGAWRAISPLRTATLALARLIGDPGEHAARPVPAAWGWWPAVPGLLVVVVLESRFPDDPTALLVALAGLGLALLGGAAVHGSAWYAAADPFEVLGDAVARCSPVARGDDGRLRLVAPWRARLLAPAPPGAAAVVGVLVGAALGDFLTDTAWWERTAPLGPARADAALLAVLACCALATAVVARGARLALVAPPLLALVTAYAATHYFPVLIIEGQAVASQLGTLARGGVGALAVTPVVAAYDVLPATLAAVVQVALLVGPHLAAVAAGHHLALARMGPGRADRAVAPLAGLLALSAVVGTALRFSAA